MVASATHPKLDDDVKSTIKNYKAAAVSTGNEGWDPTKVSPVSLEWLKTD